MPAASTAAPTSSAGSLTSSTVPPGANSTVSADAQPTTAPSTANP